MTTTMVNVGNSVCLIALSIISFSSGCTYQNIQFWITLPVFCYGVYTFILNYAKMKRECLRKKKFEVERLVTYDDYGSEEEKAQRLKLDRTLGTLDCLYSALAANYRTEIAILENEVDKKRSEVDLIRNKIKEAKEFEGESVSTADETISELEERLTLCKDKLTKMVFELRDVSMKDFNLDRKRSMVNLNLHNWRRIYLTPEVVERELEKLEQEQAQASDELELVETRLKDYRNRTCFLL